jgi:nucleosome binding factor SPN SPT16 subunit
MSAGSPNHNDLFTGPSATYDMQVIYKLGSLESLVTNSMRRIDEQIGSIKAELTTKHTETKQDLETIEKRLSKIENWKTEIVARVSVVTGGAVLFWAIFSEPIKRFFSGVF